jgi:hypothetical protein
METIAVVSIRAATIESRWFLTKIEAPKKEIFI